MQTKARAGATLDDPDADDVEASDRHCAPDVCKLGDKIGKWADFRNFECLRCGYATVSEDTVRARNPKHFK
ncbi:hypothetical protein Mpop_2679 [Methylorubrum populi BJ001]|uniref:Uncharacterized protein n=2 Tax=Methylorubrum populi TaxID=223967 RepID=B1ZCW5_METPB|nr:hypothetical protein Mpop_2679 [Methylorubrum populi BJ001]